jgi:hypothetical protein
MLKRIPHEQIAPLIIGSGLFVYNQRENEVVKTVASKNHKKQLTK